MKIENFSEIQQDTLIRPQQRQGQPSLDITVRRPNLERAEEIMRQFEQREQEVIASQRLAAIPKPKREEPVREPSIEVDSLMAKYLHIGCSPRTNFPDTFTLTVLERYYQPIPSAMTPINAADTSVALLPDSLQATIPVTAIAKPDTITGFSGETRQEGYSSSITVFILCGLFLLAIIKYHFGRNLPETFRSAFSFRQSIRLFEERRESDRQAAVLSNMLFAMIAGIFISLVLPFFGTNPFWGSYALSVLFFSFATGLLYFLKARIWQALGVVFQAQAFSKMYIFNMFLYNRNTGLIIFPLVALIPYVAWTVTPYLIYGVMAVIVLFYLLRQWRNFQIILAQNVSAFYFILYLCTLEILPLLLFVKGCKVLSELSLFL